MTKINLAPQSSPDTAYESDSDVLFKRKILKSVRVLDGNIQNAMLAIQPDAITATVMATAAFSEFAGGKENKINYQNTEPLTLFVGLLWMDTSLSPMILKRWNGTSWDVTAMTATQVSQTATSISHTVVETDVTGESVSSLINQSASTIKIQAAHIQLEGLVTINGYFKVNLDGSIEAIGGKVGGFNISDTKLYTGGVGFSIAQPNQYVIWAGETNGANGYVSTDATFLVEANGKVHMGNVDAYGGNIAGWTISSSALYKGGLKLDSANQRIYLGSTGYLYGYNGTNLIGINGGLVLSSSISASGVIQANGGLSINLGGTLYSITRDSSGYLRAL